MGLRMKNLDIMGGGGGGGSLKNLIFEGEDSRKLGLGQIADLNGGF